MKADGIAHLVDRRVYIGEDPEIDALRVQVAPFFVVEPMLVYESYLHFKKNEFQILPTDDETLVDVATTVL